MRYVVREVGSDKGLKFFFFGSALNTHLLYTVMAAVYNTGQRFDVYDRLKRKVIC